MSVIAFTGPSRHLTDAERIIVTEGVQALTKPHAFYSGAASGVDCFAAAAAIRAFPKAIHRVIIPRYRVESGETVEAFYSVDGVQGYLAGVARWYEADFEIIEGEPGKDQTDGYMKRNAALVEACDGLLAFPSTRKLHRSGTWATIRRAKIEGKPIRLIPLDGSRRSQN